jgi:hypothetical protein
MTHTKRHIGLLVVSAVTLVVALGASSAQAAYSVARVGTELQLSGDDASDVVLVNRDALGVLRVDVGADGTYEHSGASTVGNTTRAPRKLTRLLNATLHAAGASSAGRGSP